MSKTKINVLLTFDLDGETLWTSRDKKNVIGPVMLSQGKYGPTVGVPRIIDFLNEYNLPATFFVTGAIIENYPEICGSIHSNGFEIGHHNYLHEWPNRTDPVTERDAFKKGMELIKELTGAAPTGYRAPGWEFSEITMDLLFENNILYSSNMMDTELPYFHESSNHTNKVVELPCSWVLDDAAFFMHGLTYGPPQFNPEVVKEMWINEFDALYEEGEGRVFVLTMHPQIIGRASRIKMLKDIVDHILEKDDVRFVSGKEMAEIVVSENNQG